MASVSSLRSKCFGAFSEQRIRNKKSTVSERVGRSWSARKGGPLGSVGGGGGASAPITPPLYGPCNNHKPPWQPALVSDHLP